MYQDPYQNFGRLEGELWRAIRLVVDTGLHSQGWTREQVLDYMVANSAAGEARRVAETERYMAIPGQALAYKIGQLKIRELRTRAEQELGSRFDVRKFHTLVLSNGALPLDVLEANVESLDRRRARLSVHKDVDCWRLHGRFRSIVPWTRASPGRGGGRRLRSCGTVRWHPAHRCPAPTRSSPGRCRTD